MGVLAVVLIVLLVVLFLLVASVLLPARFRFRATFVQGKLEYDAAVRLPLIPRYLVLSDLARRKRVETGDHAPQSESPPSFLESVRSRIQTLQQAIDSSWSHYPEISALVSYVARSVTIREFRIESALGTGDAAETALLAGGIRACFGVVLGVMRRHGIRFKKRPIVQVTPVYDRAYISADVEVVSSIVPIRGIIALFRLVKHVRKSKTELRNAVSNAASWNTKA